MIYSRGCPVQAPLGRGFSAVYTPSQYERLVLSGVEGIPARSLFRAVDCDSLSQYLARLRENLGIGAPNVIRIQFLGRNRLSSQNLLPSQPGNRVSLGTFDFLHSNTRAAGNPANTLVRSDYRPVPV